MSELESRILEAFKAVTSSVGATDVPAVNSSPVRHSAPSVARRVVSSPVVSYRPPVPRRAVETVAASGGIHETFLKLVAPGAVCVRSFGTPVLRVLARRDYLVHGVYEFSGVTLACATFQGAIVTEAGKLHKLAQLVK